MERTADALRFFAAARLLTPLVSNPVMAAIALLRPGLSYSVASACPACQPGAGACPFSYWLLLRNQARRVLLTSLEQFEVALPLEAARLVVWSSPSYPRGAHRALAAHERGPFEAAELAAARLLAE